MLGSPTYHCDKCNKRLPKNRPLLRCSICKELQHYKCNSLTKNQAMLILRNDQLNSWSCNSCKTDHSNSAAPDMGSPSTPSLSINCKVCHKKCSPTTTVNCDRCPWCNDMCHRKCINQSLGCLNCCNTLIPGYGFDMHELLDSIPPTTLIHNP